MFQKMRKKFILLSMVSLFVLLAMIITGMNAVNYKTIVEEADSILAMMTENRGILPPFSEKKLPPFLSPETPDEIRYFSVMFGKDGEVIDADTRRITAVDEETACQYAAAAMETGRERGFIEEYRYSIRREGMEGELCHITFLDMGRKIYGFQTFLKISVCIGVAGYMLFFAVIIFFSGKIMKPVAESYEKQKRFITDAGHELKTPLAIINADVDVLKLDLEENEWLEDIHKQTKRLAGLTNDLVYLSRMEEEEHAIQMIAFPFSEVVQEAAMPFCALAGTQNKVLECDIPQLLSFTGNEKAIRQLVGILLDNAVKYSPEQSVIALKVQKQGKNLLLTVENTTCTPIPKEKLDMIFERFYRIDPSRSTMTGGYGIGLSVAKAVVNAHGGRISAVLPEENLLKIVVSLPV